MRTNHIICDCDIVYENGAIVRTSFVTSYGGDVVAQSEPRLTKLVNDEVTRLQKKEKAKLPKYEYPDHIVTAAMMQKYSLRGVDFKVRRGDCVYISAMDAQKASQKTIFGGGLLLSDKVAAERAAAERAAAEKWELSAHERIVIEYLNSRGT